MLKVIEKIRDAIPAVGQFVMLDGYTGILGVKKGLQPDDIAVTGDFRVFCASPSSNGGPPKIFYEEPLFPKTPGKGICPLLLSALDLTESLTDPDDVCTASELLSFTCSYTFNYYGDALDEDEDEDADTIPPKKMEKKKEEGPSEGDQMMDFFFSKRKKPIEKDEEREEWGTDGFEFF